MLINKRLMNEKGLALFIALMLVLMLSIIGIGIVKSSNDEIAIAGNEMHELKAFYAAEAGLDQAAAAIQTEYELTGVPPLYLPNREITLDGITISYTTVAGDKVQKTLTRGSMAGLKSLVKPFTIRSTSIDAVNRTSVSLEESFEVALVPIFQFAIFYENDLEIAPGPSMLLFGRVHSNGNAYVQSGNEINIDSYFTSAGTIYHGRKPGSGMSTSDGDVNIMGLDGVYHTMRDGGDWLDGNDAHWYDSAAARWGGRVQDGEFGQGRLNLPLDDPNDPHTIIDRASTHGGNDDSFEHQAAFKIMDGDAFSYNGSTWNNVTAELIADGSLQETTFHDKREGNDVTVYDIDMSIFKNSTRFPSNGIIYTGDDRSGLRGTRIFNAEAVGYPLTIASENPVYTKGEVNTSNKQPMAIITDALTILSDAWSDDPAVAASANQSHRIAENTEVNFSYITGNHETGAGGAAYNGGLENLPRFLEKWSNKTLKYRGSIINLWLAEEAVGEWSGDYYSPPNRDWAFDDDLTDPNKLPPGTPMVRTFIRLGWKQNDVAFSQEEMKMYEEEVL